MIGEGARVVEARRGLLGASHDPGQDVAGLDLLEAAEDRLPALSVGVPVGNAQYLPPPAPDPPHCSTGCRM